MMGKEFKMSRWMRALALLVIAGLGGCSCMARGPAQYRDDTRAALEERNEEIKACYDKQLDKDKNASGLVVVSFTIRKETGIFEEIALVEDQTTASSELSQCVLAALEGMKLDPADKRDGLATFTWEFKSYEQMKDAE